jgi:hypothetical protein
MNGSSLMAKFISSGLDRHVWNKSPENKTGTHSAFCRKHNSSSGRRIAANQSFSPALATGASWDRWMSETLIATTLGSESFDRIGRMCHPSLS